MRGAVLIIGSLIWGDTNGRQAWREERLRVGSKERVRAPIRYGRLSEKKKTFTMTFFSGEPTGWGLLTPFAAESEDSSSLVTEAVALWRVEDERASAGALGAAKRWGCVGALMGPRAYNWRDLWQRSFTEQKVTPIDPVGDDGMLRIPWPTLEGGASANCDYILATSNLPEPRVVSADEVADAWIGHGREHYFFNNVRSRIRTGDDLLIWQRMLDRNPDFLRSGKYDEAIEILEQERQGG